MGHREPGHRAAEDPAVHGAPALGGRDLLQVRNSVQEADAAVDQHALEAEAEPVQARQPLRGVAGRQAPPGRAAGAAADGGAVREGQPITRAALQRSCCAVRGDCVRGHGGACGAAEHSGLSLQSSSNPTSLEEAHFSMFLHVFWAAPLNFKNEEEGHPRLFSRFWAHSKAAPLNTKNGEEGHPRLRFLGAFKSGVTKLQK